MGTPSLLHHEVLHTDRSRPQGQSLSLKIVCHLGGEKILPQGEEGVVATEHFGKATPSVWASKARKAFSCA